MIPAPRRSNWRYHDADGTILSRLGMNFAAVTIKITDCGETLGRACGYNSSPVCGAADARGVG
jgi:hypothetical protein